MRMAIEFIQISPHTRSKGHSAVGGAAYRAGAMLADERTGEVHDFRKRTDVVYSQLMLPDGAGAEFHDREYLWNAVEHAEDKSTRRKTAQVAKDVLLALPRELSAEHRVELARNFAYDHFVKHGLAVDVAIHDNGNGNPHAHLYVTTRRLKGDRFDRHKARDLNPSFANWQGGRGFIKEEEIWNDRWRDYQNVFFNAKELNLEVDANYLIPQAHEGNIRGDEPHYLKAENDLRRKASIELAVSSPEAVLNELGRRYGVFTDRHIDRLLTKNTETPEQKARALELLTAHKDFISLGPGDDGRDRYTSKANYQLEAEMGDHTEALLITKRPAVALRHINHAIAQYGLNDEQADALYHVAQGNSVAAIVGRAGTGKSYMMNAARDMWEASGFFVSGMAFSGVAAKGLEQGSGISSHTIAYYRKLIQHDAWHLDEKSVVVMDEAGMTDLHDMAEVVRHIQQSGAKFVAIGDHDQLQPIGPGAPFRALVERIGFVEMNHIMRQKDPGDAAATLLLSKGQIGKALDHYIDKNQVHLLKDDSTAISELITDWAGHLENTPITQQIILAHKNDDVQQLNQAARRVLLANGQIDKKSQSVEALAGRIELAKGDRLLFLRNERYLGVSNGDFASILSIQNDMITARLDRDQSVVTFSTKNYQHFTYGYAATVHKSQGGTFDNVFAFASGHLWNRFLTYVAFSRHKKYLGVYASQTQYQHINALKKQLSRHSIKDSVLDWALSFSMRRGFDPDSTIGRFVDHIAAAKRAIQDKWLFVANYEAYLQRAAHQSRQETQQKQREDARCVAEFVDLHRRLGKDWSGISQSVKAGYFERDELYQNDNYKLLVQETHYKNALAAYISADIPKYQRALSLNYVSVEALKKAAIAYEREVRAMAFVGAYQSGCTITMQQHANAIVKDIKGYYGALATQAGMAGLPVQSIVHKAKHAAIHSTYYKSIRAAKTKEAKARVRLAYDYAKGDRQLRDRWAMVYRYDALKKLSKNQLNNYHQLSVKNDALAAKIYSHLAHYQQEITAFGLDKKQLSQSYMRHISRESVLEYRAKRKSLSREQLAVEILSDRRYYRHVYELDVDWKQLSKDKKDYQYKKKLPTLSSDERRALQHVMRYQNARINTYRAWSSFIKDKENKIVIPYARQTFCWAITNTRNHLAYQIALNPEKYAPFLKGMRIKPEDISKHAIAYRRSLQRKAKAKKAKARGARPYQPSNKPQKAFDQKKGQWRYAAVNQALKDMGDQLYERVLGFEGKREGAHHTRYGKGHALTYARTGNKAGCWHSFSSGEGGSGLQLLMSRQHGWGLSYEKALGEGARLAGLSPDEVTTYAAPKRQASTPIETQAQEKANKIKSARYYYETAKPIQGTLGERYLREHRHITGDISEVKFHERIRDAQYDKATGKSKVSYHPGIVVAARNEKGEITGSQTTLLDPKTANKIDPDAVGVVKRSRGEIKGSAVLIQSGSAKHVVLAEGLETGLSVAKALPDTPVYLTLGNIKNAEALTWLAKKHDATAIYFAADFDPQTQHQNINVIQSMAKHFKYEHNLDTYAVQPILGRGKKCDFNDIQQTFGEDTVKKQLSSWRKMPVPEREKLIDEKTIEANTQTLPKVTPYDDILHDAAKKFFELEKEIKAIRDTTASHAVDEFTALLTKRYETTDPTRIKEMEKQLDQYSVKIHKNKERMESVRVLYPKAAALMVSRAKQVIEKDNDRGIDL
jgi:Ti-type conjugative transfer relaxase TraA